MNEQSLNTRLQIFASLGVIAGLLIVAYELKQTKDLAQAQIMDQTYTDLRSSSQNLMGENPSVSIVKACYNPSELTHEDVVVLNGYLSEQRVQIVRWYMLDQVGDFGINWRVAGLEPYRTIFATEFGRAWFDRVKTLMPLEIAQYGEELLRKDEGWSCAEILDPSLSIESKPGRKKLST